MRVKSTASYLCDIIHEQTGRYPDAIEDDPYIIAVVTEMVIKNMPAGTHKRGLLHFINHLKEKHTIV